MRLMSMSLPLVLGSVMGPFILAGQQAQSVPSQKPTQTNAARQSSVQSPHKAATRHRKSYRHLKVARKGAKRPEYRPEYKENSVEVINGEATKKVVFQDEHATASTKNVPRALKNVPSPMKVEVVNGSSSDTQYFYGNGQDEQIEAARNQPVVIGVQSSNTRTAGGNKHPVVKRVNSAGTGAAEPASGGGPPMTNSVSPRPKRPEYQPDGH